MEILVYTPEITPRIQYIFELIFKEILNLEVCFTNNIQGFKLAQNPKISYADEPVDDELFFCRHNLLLQSDIRIIHPKCFDYLDTKAFFEVNHLQSAFPFDLFAASFYLVSRYEEYNPENERDQWNRYKAENSIAFKNQFLHRPQVNIWANHLLEKLIHNDVRIVVKKREFKQISTLDIDQIFQFKSLSFFKILKSCIHALLKRDFAGCRLRLDVWKNRKKDPYDCFDEVLELHEKYNIESRFFIQVGNYSRIDCASDIRKKAVLETIKKIAEKAPIGSHLSVRSNTRKRVAENELNCLKFATLQNIDNNRQHYLMLNLPETYRRLLHLGIHHDYTMGYAESPGFRASICTPFYFFDLENNAPLNLQIHPFCAMDATFKYYLNMRPDEVFPVFEMLKNEVKNVDGDFITIFHNDSFADADWKAAYERILK